MEGSAELEAAGTPTLELPSPYVDPELVEQLTGVTGKQAAEDTLELNTYIRDGSIALHLYATTPKQEAKAKPARTAFYTKLGWTAASHDMYNWYHDTLGHWPYGVQPGVIMQNIKFVRSLYGTEHLPDNVYKARSVLAAGPRALLDSYGYRVRLASAFGYDEASVAMILRERPLLLKLSRKAVYFYARVAADHGEPFDPDANAREVVRSLQINDRGRTHRLIKRLAGISAGTERYRSGERDESPSNFLLALNSPARQRRVGDRVMHAYFRHTPVHNRALLQTLYPNLLPYHRALHRLEDRSQEAQKHCVNERRIPVSTVEEQAAWLLGACLPGHRSNIAALNEYAREGSIKLDQMPNFDQLRQQVFDARRNFVRELGWFEPEHPMYDHVRNADAREDMLWPTPARIIDLIELLQPHVSDIPRCLAALGLWGFYLKTETMEKRIATIIEAFSDENIIDRRPGLLMRPLSRIQTSAARAAKLKDGS